MRMLREWTAPDVVAGDRGNSPHNQRLRRHILKKRESCLELAALWHFENGRISLRSSDGSLDNLSAMEVFHAVFGKVREIRGHRFGDPIAELSGLTFSRFPAEPCLRVFEAGGRLCLDVGVTSSVGQFVPVAPGVDQVVISGKWFPLQLDAMAAVGQWLGTLGFAIGAPLTLGVLIALRTRSDRPSKLMDEVGATSATIATAASPSGRDIPGLVARLYDYQVSGVGFLRMVAEQGIGCILGDEMGLGKTLQVIALLQAESNEGRQQSLIVAPATLLENWRRELGKFAPNLSIHIHAGAERPGVVSRLLGFDVTVASYETIIRDETMFAAVNWNVVALDEAQNIKNPDAQRTIVVKRLPRRVSIAVTGTPLENKVDDLWSIADFALQGLLGNLTDFRKSFSDELDDAGRLGSMVAPVVLRRRVLDVAKDLPEKIEIPQALTVSKQFADGYEALRLATLAEYESSGELVASTRLRMYCAHPKLTGKWDDDLSHEMPKYSRLLEILDEVFSSNDKALIFSTFTGMADLLTGDLSRRFPKGFFRTIDGRLAVSGRQDTVDKFFEHSGHGALVLNPKAAGVGLNITAANHVIHYNPEWNPALTDQATARAYRRKQTRPVTVHHLFFVDTVEAVMMERAAFKRQLADEAVTGHEGEVDPVSLAEALRISPV